MIGPELHRTSRQPTCAIRIRHYHSEKRAENVNKNREVIKLLHPEYKNERDYEHSCIAQMERPICYVNKSGKIVLKTECDHRRHTYKQKRVSSLFILASCKDEVDRKGYKQRDIKSNSVINIEVIHLNVSATRTENGLWEPRRDSNY